MIRNDDQIGNYFVRVFASRNQIASFQCPTLADCSIEVNRIRQERGRKPTTRAVARRMNGKSNNLRQFDDPIEITLEDVILN